MTTCSWLRQVQSTDGWAEARGAEPRTAEDGAAKEYTGRQLVAELLGLGDIGINAAVAKLATTADARAQVLLLGMVLAALEGRTPKDAWRETKGAWIPTPCAAEYLRFLAANGYPLSPIEQVVTGERDADSVYQELINAA